MNYSQQDTSLALEEPDPTVFEAAPGGGPNFQSEWDRDLRRLDVFTPDRLARSVDSGDVKPYLVAGLLRQQSVNLFVGDSGLGKTPFGIQLGVCVAAGLPFLGRPTEPGRVLFCDAETDANTFHDTVSAITSFLGLPSAPSEFLIWSPNWESRRDTEDGHRTWAEKVATRANILKPSLVIVDPLRMFWPDIEAGNDRVPGVIRSLRDTGAAWLITHHRRKANPHFAAAALGDDPHAWFQEAAGSHALVNQTDSRIGVAKHPGPTGDLLVGGFVRGSGPFHPLDVVRCTGNSADSQGYKLIEGAERLSDADRTTLASLPDRFRVAQAKAALGGRSDSNTTRFLSRCVGVGATVKENRDYIKVQRSGPDGAHGEGGGTV